MQSSLTTLDKNLSLVAITQILDFDVPGSCEPLPGMPSARACTMQLPCRVLGLRHPARCAQALKPRICCTPPQRPAPGLASSVHQLQTATPHAWCCARSVSGRLDCACVQILSGPPRPPRRRAYLSERLFFSAADLSTVESLANSIHKYWSNGASPSSYCYCGSVVGGPHPGSCDYYCIPFVDPTEDIISLGDHTYDTVGQAAELIVLDTDVYFISRGCALLPRAGAAKCPLIATRVSAGRDPLTCAGRHVRVQCGCSKAGHQAACTDQAVTAAGLATAPM